MVLTVSFVLSLMSRLVATIPGAMRSIVTKLTPASGRQDHTTSPSAGLRIRLKRTPRPPHPALHVRDDRDTPLLDCEAGRPNQCI